MGISEQEKKEARSKARTFPGLIPPNGAQLQFAMEKEQGYTYYYKDNDGNWYFIDDSMRRFEIEMQQRERQRRIRRRGW